MKWLTGIFALAVIIMGYLQFNGCSGKSVELLQHDRDSLKRSNDSLNIGIKQHLVKDSILNVKNTQDSSRFAIQIDSITKLADRFRSRAGELETQLNNTVKDLSEAIQEGNADTSYSALLKLKKQLADYENQTHFEIDIANSGIQVYKDRTDFQDSVIAEKIKTIEALKEGLIAKDAIITKLMIDLDTAIAELKSGKKIAWLSAIISGIVGAFVGHNIK